VNRLSVVIITLNEEASLPRALDSVAWCDDIVVVDSGSTDRTVEVASSRPNCRVIHQAFLGYGPQKRVAVEAAAHDWVLSIDADEVLDERLQAALRAWRETDPGDRAAYMLTRQLHFMGRRFRHGKESRDRIVRLFDRRRASFSEAAVHERVVSDGPVGSLDGRLIHYSHRDLEEYFEKFNRYTSLMAHRMSAEGRSVSRAALVVRAPIVFLQYYLLRGNLLNGFPGFVWSLLAAYYKTVKYLKLYESGLGDDAGP
jgi:glycosyltransferase involved in cell wall biosynthesis